VARVGPVVLGIGWTKGTATIVERRLVGKHTEPDMGEFADQGVEVFEFIADAQARWDAQLKEGPS
jgi:hypothetical protein